MKYFKSLYVQVLIAIALGILVGVVWPSQAASLKPLGDAFIRLIKMVVSPVVFCTVTAGIAHMGDLKRFGKLGLKTLVYFEVVSTFALVIGLLVALVVRPGAGFDTGFLAQVKATDTAAVAGYVSKAHGQNVGAFLLNLIPETFLGAFTGGELLQVVLLAVLTGVAISRMGEAGKRAVQGLDKIAEIFFAIIHVVVKFAPIGAFGAMAFTVGTYGVKSLLSLGALVGTFWMTGLLFVILVLGAIARVAGFSIFKFLRYIGDELLIVLGTSSSESALPQMMEKLERLGVAKPVVGLVVPTGYSFNLDGTNIYMTLATLFLAQATHTELSPLQIGTLLVVAMLTSKGASGVTGSGFITLAATLAAVPTIPVASLALIVGVDRFMSECRALTNTVGNGVASIVVAGWENELDRETLRRELG